MPSMDFHTKIKIMIIHVLVLCLFGHIYKGVAFGVPSLYEDTGIHDNQTWLNENKGNVKQCNLLAGTWVYDDSYPLYSAQCPFIDGKSTCRRNGRSDSDYEKWRWQPYGCNIPRFNALGMLERLRGKRLVFVGDSTNRDQWESMVCLLNTAIPNSNKYAVHYGFPLTVFKALDYQASVEFFWAPFLVEFYTNRKGKKVLHLDAIDKYGAFWKGADILVFESSHWWTHSGSEKAWDRVKIGHHYYADMDPLVAYRKALVTWTKWVSANIDPRRSLVYFRTMSPNHDTIGGNGNCYKATEPLQARRGYVPQVPPQVPILEYILKKIRFPVHLLDITRMSGYRVDGHPSIYSKRLTDYQKSRPQLYADCSHWCLPGVPDTWNQLLHASLVSHLA